MRKTILLLATLVAGFTLAPAMALAQVEVTVAGSRSMIGVHTEPATIDGQEGLRVMGVVPGMPAEGAGVRAGDFIIAVDGQPATTRLLSADRAAGTKLRLRLSRDGNERDIELETVERRPFAMQRVLVPTLPDSVLGQMAVIMSNVRMHADSLSGAVSRVWVDGTRVDGSPRIFVRDSMIIRGTPLDSGLALRAANIAGMRIGGDSIQVLRFGQDSVHVLRFGQDTLRIRFQTPGAHFDMLPGRGFESRPGGRIEMLPGGEFHYFERRVDVDSLRALIATRVDKDSILARLPGGHGTAVYSMRPSDIATTTIFAGATAIAGAELSELNPGLAEYFGVLDGVLVLNAREGTPAERAGIRAGDVIVQVNGADVRSIADIRRAVQPSAPLQMRLMRRGQAVDVTVSSE
jgi:hypothetical protein